MFYKNLEQIETKRFLFWRSLNKICFLKELAIATSADEHMNPTKRLTKTTADAFLDKYKVIYKVDPKP